MDSAVLNLKRNLGEYIDRPECFSQVAVIDTGKEPHLHATFGQLNDFANSVAWALAERNLSSGSKIAILSHNSFEFLGCFFGILRAGHVAVLVSPRLPAGEIQYVLERSQCQLVFCAAEYASLLSSNIEKVDLTENEFQSFAGRSKFEAKAPMPEDPAVILFTSGSSGHPKGVVLTHDNFGWKISSAARQLMSHNLDSGFKHFVVAPIFHMNGLHTALTVLAAMKTLVITPQLRSLNVPRVIEEYQILSFSTMPTILALMFRTIEKGEFDFSSVRFINLASAPLNEKLLGEIKRNFPNAVGNIINNYGLTELGGSLFGPHPNKQARPELSVGYPRPGIECRLVNGVLQVKSRSAMHGYLAEAELTRKRFTEDGYFITNDLFKVDEQGFYYFLGRADDMINCGGENVYMSSVEWVLDSHPEIELAVAVAVEDELKGAKPYAFVLPKPNSSICESDLIRYSLTKMTAAAHPRRIWRLTEVPTTNVEKIDRTALKQAALELLKGNPNRLAKVF